MSALGPLWWSESWFLTRDHWTTMESGTEVWSIRVQERDTQVLLMSITLKERTQRPAKGQTHSTLNTPRV